MWRRSRTRCFQQRLLRFKMCSALCSLSVSITRNNQRWWKVCWSCSELCCKEITFTSAPFVFLLIQPMIYCQSIPSLQTIKQQEGNSNQTKVQLNVHGAPQTVSIRIIFQTMTSYFQTERDKSIFFHFWIQLFCF